MLILSLLAAILVLSIKTGLVLGSSWLSMPKIFGWAGLFGGSIILFSNIFHEKYRLIGYFIDQYTFAFACIAGLLFVYLGLEYTAETGASAEMGVQAGEQTGDQTGAGAEAGPRVGVQARTLAGQAGGETQTSAGETRTSAGETRTSAGETRISVGQAGAQTRTVGEKAKYWLSFLPCPFCVGALVVSVIYTAGGLKLPFLAVAAAAGISFTLGTTLVSLLLRRFMQRFNFSLTSFFHHGLLILGVFTLLSAFLIPNIVKTMQDRFIPMVLGSKKELLLSAAGFFVLIAAGFGKEMLTGFRISNWRR